VTPDWRYPVAKYHNDLETPEVHKGVVRGMITLQPKEHHYIPGD